MKKLTSLFCFLAMTLFGYSQTVIFNETFETLPLSVTSSGTPGWSRSHKFAKTGTYSDSSRVVTGDTSYLTTNSFSTVGNAYVILEFAQICKIEFFDGAEIDVSTNNGLSWTKLVAAQYLGSGQFGTEGDKFTSASYPIWAPGTATQIPQNAWWENEMFDISSVAANHASVKVRFKLYDGNNNGNAGNYGWLLDNIKVTEAASELIPPVVTLQAPIIQDTVFTTNPYEIKALITDASGIDSAYVVYKINSGTPVNLHMTLLGSNIYHAYIPSQSYNTHVDYQVFGVDASPAANVGHSTAEWFYVKKGPDIVTFGTGTIVNSTYTYPAPYGNEYFGARHQMMIKASELTAAGVSAGQIVSVGFNVATIAGTPLQGFTVKIGQTTQNDLSTWVTAGLTTVFTSSSYTDVLGWNTHTFSQPFTWNGTSNLVVETCFDNTSYTTNAIMNQSTTSFISTIDYFQDATNVCTSTSISSTYSQRPNIQIGLAPNTNSYDAGISQIIEPVGTVLSGVPLPVNVRVKNFGVQALTSAQIGWSVNGVAQTPVPWTGNLTQDQISNPVNLGQYTFVSGPYVIKAWTHNPNGQTDQKFINDTTTVNVFSCAAILNGTYTIGGVTSNYPTISAALTAMQNCGINGPVIFNLQSGTYNEQIDVPEINGASTTNTITFQSATGNSADVTWQFATTTTNNYVIKLDGADHFRFKNMTLKSTGTNFAHVVEMTGDATDNQFDGNKIMGIVTTSSLPDFALVYSASGTTSLDSMGVFNNNTFTNGSYGMYYEGGSTSSLENNTKITNNTFTNQYYTGIHLYYQDSPLISGNTIVTNSTYSSYYGIDAGYCNNGLKILKNKIAIQNGGYGIYIYFSNGVTANPGLIANNFIQVGGTGTAYGIYPYYSTYQNFYYNSINITSNNATSGCAMYLYYGSTVIDLKNNILANNGGGYSFYSVISTGITSNYNDLFTTGANLGYWNLNCTNIAAWRTASLQDANSISYNPSYTSITNLHTFDIGLNGLATPIATVTDDIDGDPRNATTPDIGADEFTPLATDLGILSVVSPLNSCSLGSTENVTLKLKNFGGNPITNADIYYILDNGTLVHGIFTGNIAPNTTYNFTFTQQADLSTVGNHTFKFYVALTGDMNILNDTLSNYTISNGWNFNNAANTMGFETTDDMSLWTSDDANADGYGWTFPYAGSTHSGSNSAQLYNGYNAGDDWLFSRCFKLIAGSTYKIEFWYEASYSSSPQNIDLKVGNNNTPAAMTTTLLTLSSFSNTTYQKASVNFTPTTTGSYIFGWWGHSTVTYEYAYIDDINISLVPLQEATMLAVTAPVSGCGLSSAEPVSIKIKNTGSNTINGNLTAYYKFNGGTTFSEPVTSSILPNDTLNFTFSQTINPHVVNTDAIFPLRVWLTLIGDPFQFNDTLNSSIASSHVPANPVTISDTVIYGTSATLKAISTDSVYWYNLPIGGTTLASGHSYVTPNLFATTTYYVQALTPGGSKSWNFDNNLDGWTPSSPCSSPVTWTWASDGGKGTAFAVDYTTNSSQILTSPVIDVNGSTNMILSYTHRFSTETGWDHGFVAYRLDGGAWAQFTPTIGAYTTSDGEFNEPLWNSCNISPNMPLYDGTMNYATHSGNINTSGASTLEIAFVFTTDGSGAVEGWYIDNVKLDGGMGGCASTRVTDTAYVQLYSWEASVASMTSPVDQCTNGSENVTINIKNNGSNTINGNLIAKYSVNGGTPVSQPVLSTILPGGTLTFTFATPINAGLTISNQDSVYNIKAYVKLTGDVYPLNDTIQKSVTLKYTPPVPVVSNITIPYATSGTVHATAANPILWFNVPSGGTKIGTGTSYTTPVLFGTAVYYAEAKAGSGNDSLNTIFTGGNGCAGGNMFDLKALSSDITVTGFNISPYAAGALSVSAYYKSGTYVGSETTPGAWTLLGTYNVTSLGAGIQTYLDVDDFVIPAGQVTGIYLYFNATYTTLASVTTYSNTDLQITAGAGLCGLFSSTNTPRVFNGTVFYGSGSGCASARIADTVFVSGTPPCDMSVQAIYTPNSAIELTNHELVKVKVKNFGTSPAVKVPIHYRINGGTSVNDTIQGPIAPNDTSVFTFATAANLSAYATYNFKVYTTLACDATHINDTLQKTVVCSPLLYCTSASLYSYCNISNVTISNLNNGVALPVYNNSSCVNTFTNYTSLSPALLIAGMTYPISVSECNSSTYFEGALVNVYLDYNRNGVFDSPQELIFSATTSAAMPTVSGTFTVPTTGVITDAPLRMRVVLDESGVAPACGTYYYGETEDYTVIISPQIPHDAGVTAFVQPLATENEGASVPIQVVIKNFGLDSIMNSSNMMIAYSYNGGPVQSINWNGGNIPPLATDTATLPNITIVANTHSLCAWTALAGDSNTINDTTCMTIEGTPLHDAGVTAFIQPSSQLIQGANKTVQVIFKNFGLDTITALNLVYKVNGVIQATQPWTGILLSNATDTVTFTQTFVVPAASFSICAYTLFASDANHANDTSCTSSYGVFTGTLPYYDNFDGTMVNWSENDNGAGSVWQLGTPSYGATNSVHSTPNAWDINLSTAYTNSAIAYLYTQNFDFSTAINAKMKFWLNYNLETSWDGVRIDYSIDTSATWNTLGVMSDPNGVNWYNSSAINSSSKPGWTGASSGWKQSEYKLSLLNQKPIVRFRFVFTSDASGVYDGVSVDDFSIVVPAHKDAGVTQLVNITPIMNGGDILALQAKIMNFGIDTLHSIPVKYSINGGTPITETWMGTLLPDSSVTYTFTTTFSIPVNQFSICSWTQLANDGNTANDTTCTNAFGIPLFTVPYTDDFEGTANFYVTGLNNQWQHGVPTSSIINTAHSPVNVWKTNLSGNYSNSSNYNLYSPRFNFTNIVNAEISFWHWYETEASFDGGRLQYTTNNGTTWQTLGTVSDPLATNWYNYSSINGSPAFSGSSSGWVYSSYNLAQFNNYPVPVQFRFNFYSNVSNNNNGWAIDDFEIFQNQIPKDAGVTAILTPGATSVIGTSETVQVTIKNFGTDALTSIPVRYRVNNGVPVSETWTGNLASGATTNFSFTTPLVQTATYNLCAYTSLSGDSYHQNDTTCKSVQILQAQYDAGITEITVPDSQTVYSTPITVSVKIKNFGTQVLNSVNLQYSINAGTPVLSTYTGTINPGSIVTHTFTQTYTSPSGNYSFCAKTNLSTDQNATNDQICKTVKGTVGIEDNDGNSLSLGQNMPNPASGNTIIPYSLPTNGNIKFEIVNILGQLVYTVEDERIAGKHIIEINADKLTDGVYFYTLTFNEQRLTRRLVVNK